MLFLNKQGNRIYLINRTNTETKMLYFIKYRRSSKNRNMWRKDGTGLGKVEKHRK